jgi:N-succinyldiaminopimelate aminotransferase
MSAIRAVATHQVYCVAHPMQVLAARALRDGGDWLDETRALYAQAARRTADALGAPAPAAGTFVFFEPAAGWCDASGALPFLEQCLDAGVLLTPGAACGRDFGGWVRACFTTLPPHELDAALACVRAVMGGTRPAPGGPAA